MTVMKRESHRSEVVPRGFDFLDRFFDDWPEMLRRPILFWPERGLAGFRVEEFHEHGAYVVKAELAGLDPEKDVDISVHNGMLHIAVERREEEKTEERDYVRREIRYGSFHRDLPLPEGASESDVKATYKNGVLEIRVPIAAAEPRKQIPVVTD
jgi:HSP20 family protein